MQDNRKAAILAAFAADALALGVHWIYNTHVIDRKYGRVEDLLAPQLAKFHAGKRRGDFTHYGDQMLLLLETVAGDRTVRSVDLRPALAGFCRRLRRVHGQGPARRPCKT